MEQLLFLALILACPLMMLMMRGSQRRPRQPYGW